MDSSTTLTELREAALAVWKRQKEEQERDSAKEAAERALDVFGDTAGPLADPESWRGNDDGDAVAVPALDLDGGYRLEYDHTFDEELWLRSGCPSCGGERCRVTPVGTLLELGQALDRLQAAWSRREQGGEVDADDLPGACDHCDEPTAPAERLYQAVLAVIESAGVQDEEESQE
ncbi:MAG TPA: hypothetical protein VFA46_17505 [Actinomycetes bacterium]|jgi:hypothetical protein|nr:hypothetical protein [Actinomycetes bacterium]